MVFLITDGIGCMAQCFGDMIFSRRGSITNDLAPTDFVIGYEPKPAGKTFGGWEFMQIVAHISQQAQNRIIADARYGTQVGSEVLVSQMR